MTVGGAIADARVISHPLPPDLDLLEALYREEVAAYFDGLAFLPSRRSTFELVVDLLEKLDPGKPLVLDAVPFPADPEETLVEAARNAVAGTVLTFFAISESDTPSLAALKIGQIFSPAAPEIGSIDSRGSPKEFIFSATLPKHEKSSQAIHPTERLNFVK